MSDHLSCKLIILSGKTIRPTEEKDRYTDRRTARPEGRRFESHSSRSWASPSLVVTCSVSAC